MSKYPDMTEIFARMNARSERLRALPVEEQEQCRIVLFGTEYEVFKLPRPFRTTLNVASQDCESEIKPWDARNYRLKARFLSSSLNVECR